MSGKFSEQRGDGRGSRLLVAKDKNRSGMRYRCPRLQARRHVTGRPLERMDEEPGGSRHEMCWTGCLVHEDGEGRTMDFFGLWSVVCGVHMEFTRG